MNAIDNEECDFMQVNLQRWNEERYSKKGIDKAIRASIDTNADMQAKIAHGVTLVNDYMNQTYSYKSKNCRVVQLRGMDIPALVTELIVGISYFQGEELFTSATAQLAGRLKWDDKRDAIVTVAELLGVLCETDAFDVCKASRSESLVVISRVPFEADLIEYINGCTYLPPMVCEPLELTNNRSGGYLTYSDSLILKPWNYHDGDICLDSLNIINSVAFRLDTDFVGAVEEDPNTEFTIEKAKNMAAERGVFLTDGQAMMEVAKQKENWMGFKKQSYAFYLLMATQGNKFWFTSKVDKRGRIYCAGHNLSYQGTAFKKASLELAHEELITGTLT